MADILTAQLPEFEREIELDDEGMYFFSQLKQKKKECVIAIRKLREQIAECDFKIEEERTRLGRKDPQAEMKALVNRAIMTFQDSPRRGVSILIDGNYFPSGGTAQEIAGFLHDTPELDKTAIGEYLGEHKPLNLEVLEEFSKLHKFDGLSFDAALRKYLWSFRLPGESQKIDRMMETFAKRFMECNDTAFRSADGCYILAFATIMLNTSLHNPSVTRKTTIEQFISMNRGIDDGQDIPQELLKEIYESIQQSPFKIPDSEAGLSFVFFDAEKEGWLKKEGGSAKTWKHRWVVVKSNCLYYFKSKDDESPCGIVPLANVEVNIIQAESGRKRKDTGAFFFELVGKQGQTIKGCKTNSKGMVVQGNHKRYLFKSTSEEEVQEWVDCIRAAVQEEPFLNIQQLKNMQNRRKSMKAPTTMASINEHVENEEEDEMVTTV